MKPLHAHGASQPILGFISIDVFFHTVTACASKLRERIEIMVCVPASFFGGAFWVQQGSLLFDRKKTERQTNAKRALDSHQV